MLVLLSQPSNADFWDAWEIGSHLGTVRTNDLKLIISEVSSSKTLKERLHLNQRYDRLIKTTFLIFR